MAIDQGNCVVAHIKAYNMGDSDQIIHTVTIEFDCVRVNIIDPLDENAPLLISHREMTTIIEAVGAFIAWPKKLITLHTQVCCQN